MRSMEKGHGGIVTASKIRNKKRKERGPPDVGMQPNLQDRPKKTRKQPLLGRLKMMDGADRSFLEVKSCATIRDFCQGKRPAQRKKAEKVVSQRVQREEIQKKLVGN